AHRGFGGAGRATPAQASPMGRRLLQAVVAACAAASLAPASAQGPLAQPGLLPRRRLKGGSDIPPLPDAEDGAFEDMEWSAEDDDVPAPAPGAHAAPLDLVWVPEDPEAAEAAEKAAEAAEKDAGGEDAGGEHAGGEDASEEDASEDAATGESHGDAAEAAHDAEEGHGAEGHAEEGHGHGHEPADPARAAVSRALGFCLMGSVAWIMMVYYQVNSKDEDIAKATWHILNDMLSIFVAVLIFASTKHVSVDYFGEEDGHNHKPPGMRSSLIAVVRLLIFFALVHVLIHNASKLDSPLWSMKSVGIVGGHVIGFAAIDVFGGLLEQPFSQSFACVFTVVASIVLFSGLLYLFSHKLLKKLGGDEEYHEVARECDTDGACLCYGLLVSMIVRYAIAGHMPPIHGAPKDKTTQQVLTLLAATVVFGVLVVVIGNQIVKASQKKRPSPLAEHAMELTQLTSSMAMGWCVLFWGQWLFWAGTGGHGVGTGSRMSARMLMAMVFSLACFMAIRIVDFFADRASRSTQKGLRQLLSTFGIVMGLTWEACFTEAIEGITGDYHGTYKTVADLGFTLILCAVVLPAWAMYILPKVLEDEEGKKEKQKETNGDAEEPGSSDDEKSSMAE
ncbi:unnamed protein product, partial [Prorocentrum cordatum]